MKIDRLLGILMMLIKKRKVSARELSEYFEVSVRTIQRDMQRKTELTYYDVEFNKTARIFCPYSLVLISSTWYVYGFCELRSGFRMFKVSRIADCTMLDESFEIQEINEELPWETGGDDDSLREEIVLEIDRINRHILPDYIEPSKYRIVEDKIIVKLNFLIDQWLYSQLMTMVPYVRVIKPDSLREGFVAMLKKSIDRNNYDI